MAFQNTTAVIDPNQVSPQSGNRTPVPPPAPVAPPDPSQYAGPPAQRMGAVTFDDSATAAKPYTYAGPAATPAPPVVAPPVATPPPAATAPAPAQPTPDTAQPASGAQLAATTGPVVQPVPGTGPPAAPAQPVSQPAPPNDALAGTPQQQPATPSFLPRSSVPMAPPPAPLPMQVAPMPIGQVGELMAPEIEQQQRQNQQAIEQQHWSAESGWQNSRTQVQDNREEDYRQHLLDQEQQKIDLQKKQDANAAATEDQAETGRRYVTGLGGVKTPINDPVTGKPLYTAGKLGETTDDDTGRPVIQNRTTDGTIVSTTDYKKWDQDDTQTAQAAAQQDMKSGNIATQFNAAKYLHGKEIEQLQTQADSLQDQMKQPDFPKPLKPELRATLEQQAKDLSVPIPPPEAKPGALYGTIPPTQDDIDKQKQDEAERITNLAKVQEQFDADDNRKATIQQALDTRQKLSDSKVQGPGGFLRRYQTGQSYLTDTDDSEKKNDIAGALGDAQAQQAQRDQQRQAITTSIAGGLTGPDLDQAKQQLSQLDQADAQAQNQTGNLKSQAVALAGAQPQWSSDPDIAARQKAAVADYIAAKPMLDLAANATQTAAEFQSLIAQNDAEAPIPGGSIKENPAARQPTGTVQDAIDRADLHIGGGVGQAMAGMGRLNQDLQTVNPGYWALRLSDHLFGGDLAGKQDANFQKQVDLGKTVETNAQNYITDPTKDKTLLAKGSEFAGGMAPFVASGFAAPVVAGLTMKEAGREMAKDKGASDSVAEGASVPIGLVSGGAYALLGPAAGKLLGKVVGTAAASGPIASIITKQVLDPLLKAPGASDTAAKAAYNLLLGSAQKGFRTEADLAIQNGAMNAISNLAGDPSKQTSTFQSMFDHWNENVLFGSLMHAPEMATTELNNSMVAHSVKAQGAKAQFITQIANTFGAIDASPEMTPEQKAQAKDQSLHFLSPSVREIVQAHVGDVADANRQAGTLLTLANAAKSSLGTPDPQLDIFTDAGLAAEKADVANRLGQKWVQDAAKADPNQNVAPDAIDPTLRHGTRATKDYFDQLQAEQNLRQQRADIQDQVDRHLADIQDEFSNATDATQKLASTPGGVATLAEINRYNSTVPADQRVDSRAFLPVADQQAMTDATVNDPQKAATALTKQGQPTTPQEISKAQKLAGHSQNMPEHVEITEQQHAQREEISDQQKAGNKAGEIQARQKVVGLERQRKQAILQRLAQNVKASREIDAARMASDDAQAHAEALKGHPKEVSEPAQKAFADAKQKANRASGLAKISNGMHVSKLTAGELAAVGAVPDGTGGFKPAVGVADVAKDPTKELSPVTPSNGGTPIITDEGARNLAKYAPETAKLIYDGETDARQKADVRADAAAKQGAKEQRKEAAGPDDGKKPAGGSWTARGDQGTEVSVPASEAGSQREAEPLLARKLPKGELLDLGSVEAPPKPKEVKPPPLPKKPADEAKPAPYSDANGKETVSGHPGGVGPLRPGDQSHSVPEAGQSAEPAEGAQRTDAPSEIDHAQVSSESRGEEGDHGMGRVGSEGTGKNKEGAGALPSSGSQGTAPERGGAEHVARAVDHLRDLVDRLNSANGLTGDKAVTIEHRSDAEAPTYATIRPDGKITIIYNSARIDQEMGHRHEQDGGDGPTWLNDAFNEELVHVADFLSAREKWEKSDGSLTATQFHAEQRKADLSSLEHSLDGADGDHIANAIIRAALSYKNLGNEKSNEAFDKWLKSIPGSNPKEQAKKLIEMSRTGEDNDFNKLPDWALTCEIIRQVVQAKRRGEITETGYRSAVGRLIDWMRGVLVHLKKLGNTPQMQAITKRIEEILDSAEPPKEPAPKAPVETGPIPDGVEATGARGPPSPAFKQIGYEGVAYTDNNDPVSYKWAVADVDDLIISNHDAGAVNALYPKELQPRDRSTPGSQAQVNDIAKNANLERLSSSESVGGGAPIVGQHDAVAESGNGRLMGLRRAYDQGLPSVADYREKLAANADKFGLDGDAIKAMRRPVLVRVRTTDLDRRKFSEAANVSNVAPMRESETAKKDARNLTPSIFSLFHPGEDGNIAAPSNQEFIRAFNREIVPQSERPAFMDSRGALGQAGLRRLRNAVFAYAYGDSPEALNALNRMAETIDSDGKNITNALLGAAPSFAEQNAKIKAGGLHPLSITGDLLKASQSLMELRSRGEKISDYLKQGQLLPDGNTPFQRDLMTWFDKNGRSSKRMTDVLNRYAHALDMAGDPRQGDLLGSDKPTKEGLFKIAQKEPQMALLAGDRGPTDPKLAMRFFNRMFNLERSGVQLNAGQRGLMDRTENSLAGDLFAQEAGESAEVPPDKKGALSVYNRLKAIRDGGKPLDAGQSKLMEQTEKILGQQFIPGTDQATAAKPPARSEAPPKVRFGQPETGIKHELEATPSDMFGEKPVGQQSLFAGDRSLDMRDSLTPAQREKLPEKDFGLFGKTGLPNEPAGVESGHEQSNLNAGGKPPEANRPDEEARRGAEETFQSAASAARENGPSVQGVGSVAYIAKRDAEAAALTKWAADNGKLLPSNYFEDKSLKSAGTAEHKVYIDDSGRVIKQTNGGFYGQIPVIRGDRIERLPATPSEYLDRSRLQNQVFHDDLNLEGIKPERSLVLGEGELPTIVTSQSYREPLNPETPHPSDARVSERMKEEGFLPSKNKDRVNTTWYRPEDGILVGDAKADNFILDKNNVVVPIDLQMSQVDPKTMPDSWKRQPEDQQLNAGSREGDPNQPELDFSDKDKKPGELVMENRGLARAIAAKYSIPGVERDDILQEANKGLIKAAQTYDPSSGAKFSTYAYRVMQNGLNDVYGKQTKIAAREEGTLDQASPDTGLTREETTPDDKASTTLPVERKETQAIIDEEVRKLPKRPQAIIEGVRQGKNGQEIADELGITRQAVHNSLDGSLAVLRQRLKARGLEGHEDGILYAGDRNDREEYLKELMRQIGSDMPSQAEIDKLGGKAIDEPVGQQTIGTPEKANYAKDRDTRRRIDAIQDLADSQRETKTQQEAVDQARARVDRDPRGEIENLLKKSFDSVNYGTLSDVDVKVAQLLVPRLMREAYESGDKSKIREAATLAWAYDAAGADQARAFGARRDPFKTPAERHIEFLTKMISTPGPKERAEIRNEADPAKRRALLDKAQGDRLDKITKALGDMGVRLEDVFAGEAAVHLKSTKMVHDAVMAMGDARMQKAGRMILDKYSAGQIAKEIGVSKKQAEDLQQKFRANLRPAFMKYGARGFSKAEVLADLRNSDLSKLFAGEGDDVRKGLTGDELYNFAEDCLDEVTGKIADVNSGKMQRRLKRRVDKALPYDGRGPSDAPIPGYEPMKQDQMKPGLTPEEQAEYNRTRRPNIDPADAARYRQQQIEYDKELPYEHVKFDPNNKEQVFQLARAMQAADGNKFDMVYEAWINSILSGPQTHVALSMGMAGNAAWDFSVQRGIEAMTNAAFFHDPNAAQFGEFKPMLKAVFPAIARALKFGSKVFNSEEHYAFERSVLNQQLEFKGAGDVTGGSVPAIPGKLGRVIRLPSRVVMFQDSFFKQVIGQMEASAQAYRLGKAQGLSGADLENYIHGQVNLPGSDAWQRAVAKAEEGTFQTKLRSHAEGGGPVEGIARKVQDLRHGDASTWQGQIGEKMLGFLFPFIRTPYNIFRTGLSKTPLGGVAVAGRIADGLFSLKNGKPFIDGYSKAQMVRDLATQTIAWGTAAMLYGMIEGDKDDDSKGILITGSRPHGVDKQGSRDLANRVSGGPYQIRIGGRNGFYINYGRIEPFATVLGTVADAIRISKQGQDLPTSLAKYGGYFMSQAQDKTFLQGISSVAEAAQTITQDPKNVANGLERQFLQGLVPNLIRQPLRNLDDYERDTSHAGPGYAMTDLGGMAPKKYDLYGNPEMKQGDPLSRIVARSGDIPTGVLQRGDALLTNWNRTNPDQTYYPARESNYTYKNALGKKVSMTPEQIAEFDRRSGKAFAGNIDGWLTPQMAKTPTEEDIKMFREELDKARKATKDEMFPGGMAANQPTKMGRDYATMIGLR